jgi:tetratricopeptide (TPR) repeat protein
MDFLRKWILPVGIVLCGTVLCYSAYDRAVPIRNIIWCAVTIALLLCTKTVKVGKIHFFALGYLGITLLTGLWAINKSEWFYWSSRALLLVAFLSVAEISPKRLAKTMIVLGCIFAIYFWFDYNYAGRFMHCRGLMRQRNIWAASHFFIIPFCYYAYTHKFWRVISVFLAVIMAVHIVLLNSRSAMAGLIVSGIVLAIVNKRIRWYAATTVVLIVITIAVFRDNALNTLSMQYRLKQWKPTLKMIANNPFGVGAGNFMIQFPNYARGLDIPDAFSKEQYRFCHNDFLWEWSEIGHLGIACLMGMYGLSIYYAWKKKHIWLLMLISGYMAIAFFTAPRDRVFPTLIMALIFLSCERNRIIAQPRILLSALIFTMVVFGFRMKASVAERYFEGARNIEEKIVATSKGDSFFSTLTYETLPWKAWAGIAFYDLRKPEACIPLLKDAYRYHPYNVFTVNGMGLVHLLEGNKEEAEKYFSEAVDICPDFQPARNNLNEIKGVAKK